MLRSRTRPGTRPVHARAIACAMALVTIFAVAPTSAAPSDIFSIAAPTVGSDPPHGTDLKRSCTLRG